MIAAIFFVACEDDAAGPSNQEAPRTIDPHADHHHDQDGRSDGEAEIGESQRAEPGFTFVSHTTPADIAVPEGMVYVPGGTTRIGYEHATTYERPVFEAEVKPFFLDIHPVTVAEFSVFVASTGYETEAERFGDGGVFDPKTGGWSLVKGADWRHPRGPGHPAAPDDHPVTQVSWNDAAAYAKWAGRRLPTEVEWEHAARNAQNGGPKYAWGDELVVDGVFMANAWQGSFPSQDSGADGYQWTAPVGRTGKSPLGLTDMGGNVWEWVDDWFRSYADRGTPFTPDETSEKVQRGGSFLCDPKVCHGYRVSARAFSTPETSLAHVGFRCARDIN